jgi:hypothetical protein
MHFARFSTAAAERWRVVTSKNVGYFLLPDAPRYADASHNAIDKRECMFIVNVRVTPRHPNVFMPEKLRYLGEIRT